jgi:hypothetical protein
MTRRLPALISAAAALLIGLGVGRFIFLPSLHLAFPDWVKQLAAESAQDSGAAALGFCLALGSAAMMGPVAALVTERFAKQANYSHAMAKAVMVGALAFGCALFYQHENLASQARLMARLPQVFGSPPARHLADNPLTTILWFTAVCLVIFGPLDLWIARLQKAQRKPVPAAPAPGSEPER